MLQASGRRQAVHALGNVVEGPPKQVWPLRQAEHQATLASGAKRTLSVIQVSSGARAGGPRGEDRVRRFHPCARRIRCTPRRVQRCCPAGAGRLGLRAAGMVPSRRWVSTACRAACVAGRRRLRVYACAR